MAGRDIVVIGASTGGIEALQLVAKELPKDLAAAIFVVLHVAPSSPNLLGHILTKAGPLPACIARNWEAIKPGQIYVAPSDHHLVLEPTGHMRTTRGPKENRFRPAIDVLFRSAARSFGPRVVGVVLTGFLDDGTAGLWSIKQRGGVAVVQNPEDAVAPSMPLSALNHIEVDYCAPLKEIPSLLVRLASAPVEDHKPRPLSERMETEVKIAREDNAMESGILNWGRPSLFTCPECHGTLLEHQEGGKLRFRCHTGHGYSLDALLAEVDEQTETTLWNAARSIDEKVLLMRRLAEQLQSAGQKEAAEAILAKALLAEQHGQRVRQALMFPAQAETEHPE